MLKKDINCIIYKCHHIPSGKVYIGQTSRTLEIRKKNHYNQISPQSKTFRRAKRAQSKLGITLRCLKPLTIFHQALKQYPKYEFKWTILEENVSYLNRLERERYWIDHYSSNDPEYGFNTV